MIVQLIFLVLFCMLCLLFLSVFSVCFKSVVCLVVERFMV